MNYEMHGIAIQIFQNVNKYLKPYLIFNLSLKKIFININKPRCFIFTYVNN